MTAVLQVIMFHDIHEMIILSTIPTLNLTLNSLTSRNYFKCDCEICISLILIAVCGRDSEVSLLCLQATCT